MPGDAATGGVRRDVFEKIKATQTRIHSLARRKRRSGLSLAVGRRPAR